MNQLVPIMWKNVLYTVWFLDFVTVFKESYNCQTSHYLGRNRLPNACLVVLSYLVFEFFTWLNISLQVESLGLDYTLASNLEARVELTLL